MSDTTTIRVTTATRDKLNALASRTGESAGDLIARLVRAADEDALLGDAEAAFVQLADDPGALAAYRREAGEIEAGFDAPPPAW